MKYGSVSLEKRLKDNIRNYSLAKLYDLSQIEKYFANLCKAFQIELLLTERHGEKAVAAGDFASFEPDVVKEPGRKIRVADRTIGHMYAKVPKGVNKELINTVIDDLAELYSSFGDRQYRGRETAIYADELEERLEQEAYQAKHGEHTDALTGVLNKTYFDSRLNEMEKDGTAPDALICFNINDWKFVNDHYGEEESDRLISVIADIICKEAGEGYLIGRVDGDVFYVVISVPDEEEAEGYCKRVQESCQQFDDAVLAPSVAAGLVYRTNVEENFIDLFTDAEYEMFRNKFTMKNEEGYKTRLAKGLTK